MEGTNEDDAPTFETLLPFDDFDATVLNEIMKRLKNIENLDENIFSDLNDFLFRQPNETQITIAKDIKQDILQTYMRFMAKYQTNQEDILVQTYRIRFLQQFITFFVTIPMNIDFIQTFIKHLQIGSYEEINSIFNMIRITIESEGHKKEDEIQLFKVFLPAIIFRKSYIFNDIENMNIDQLNVITSLSHIVVSAAAYTNMFNQQFSILFSEFAKIIHNPPPSMTSSYESYSSYLILQIKIAALFSYFIREQHDLPEIRSEKSLSFIPELLIKTRDSNLVHSNELGNHYRVLLKSRNIQELLTIDDLVKFYEMFLDFKIYSNDNYTIYLPIIQSFLEIFKIRDGLDMRKQISLAKLISGLIHIKHIGYIQLQLYVQFFFKILKEPNLLIVNCFMYSVNSGMVDLLDEIIHREPENSTEKAIYENLLNLGHMCEKFNQCLTFLDCSVSYIFSKELLIPPTTYNCLVHKYGILMLKSLTDTMTNAFLYIVKLQQKISESKKMLEQLKIDINISKYYKQSQVIFKTIPIFEKCLLSLPKITESLMELFRYFPNSYSQHVWEQIFEAFFNDKSNLDEFETFGYVANSKEASSFMQAFLKHAVKQINRWYNVETLIEYYTKFFTHFKTIEITNQALLSEGTFLSMIQKKGAKLITTIKDFGITPSLSSMMLELIKSACSFFDNYFVKSNGNFSSVIFAESFFNDYCKTLRINNCPYSEIESFISFCASKDKLILSYPIVIDTLVSILNKDNKITLTLLRQSYKSDPTKFTKAANHKELFISLSSLLDLVDVDQKTIILKFMKKLPFGLFPELDTCPQECFEDEFIVIENNKKHMKFATNKFFDTCLECMDKEPNNCTYYDLFVQGFISIVNKNRWDLKTHQKIQYLLCQVIKLSLVHPDQTHNYLCRILAMSEANIILYAHYFVALCNQYLNPPEKLVYACLAIINTTEKFKLFINEIHNIFDIQLNGKKIVGETICIQLIKYLPENIFDPLSLAYFLHRIISNSYQKEIKGDQKLNCLLNFAELSYLPINAQKILLFCKNCFKNRPTSMTPMLNLYESQSIIHYKIIVCELMSSSAFDKEIKEFISKIFETSEKYDIQQRFWTIGLLLRTFPQACECFKPEIQNILDEPKYYSLAPAQIGAFLSFLVPVYKSGIDFPQLQTNSHTIYNALSMILNAPLGNRQQLSLVYNRYQVQHILKELQHSDREGKIRKLFETQFQLNGLLLNGNEVSQLTMQWKKCYSILATYFPLFPGDIIIILQNYLKSISTKVLHEVYNIDVRELLNNLITIIRFVSARPFTDELLLRKLYKPFAEDFTNMLITCSFIKFSKIESNVIQFYSASIPAFQEFFVDNVNKNDNSFQEFFIKLFDKHPEFVRKLPFRIDLNPKGEVVLHMFTRAIITTYLPKPDTAAIFKVFKKFILQENLTVFLFDRFSYFFLRNDTTDFFDASLKLFNIGNPMFILRYTKIFKDYLEIENPTIQIFQRVFFEKYSHSVAIQFIHSFLLPFIKKNKKHSQVIAELFRSKLPKYAFSCFLNFARDFDDTITFDFDILSLIKSSTSHEEALQYLLYWAGVQQEKDFDEIFDILMKNFSLHLPYEVRKICEILKLPNGFVLPNRFFELFKHFSLNSSLINSMLTIMTNNKIELPNDCRFVLYSQYNSMMNSKTSIKISIKSFVTIARYFGKVHPKLPELMSYMSRHLSSFALKIIITLISHPDTHKKLGSDFLEEIHQLIKIFGVQIPYTADLVKGITDFLKPRSCNRDIYFTVIEKYSIALKNISKVFKDLKVNEQIVEMYYSAFELLKSKEATLNGIWAIVGAACYQMFNNEYVGEKLCDHLIESIKDTEVLARAFPLLWYSEETGTLRISELIPFAMEYYEKTNQGSNQLQTIIFAKSFVTFMIGYPYSYTNYYLMKHLTNMQHNEFVLLVLKVINNNEIDQTMKNKLNEFIEQPRIQDLIIENGFVFDPDFLSTNNKLKLNQHIDTINFSEDGNHLVESAVQLSQGLDTEPTRIYSFLLKMYNNMEISSIDHNDNIEEFVKDFDYLLELSKWKKISISLYPDFEFSSMSSIPAPILYKQFNFIDKIQSSIPNYLDKLNPEDVDNLMSCYVDKSFKKLLVQSVENVQKREELSLNVKRLIPHITFSTLPYYLISHEIINALKSSHDTFKFMLAPVYPPFLHEFYQNVRELASCLVTQRIGDAIIDLKSRNVEHAKWFNQSNIIFNYSQSPHSENLKEETMRQMFLSIFNGQPITDQIIEASLNFLSTAIKTSPKNDIYLSVLVQLIDNVEMNVFSLIPEFNAKWGYYFAHLIASNDKYKPLISKIHGCYHSILVTGLSEYPADLRPVASFIDHIKQITELDEVQKLKRNRMRSEALINEFRTRSIKEELLVDETEPYDGSLFIHSLFTPQIIPPLCVKPPNVKTYFAGVSKEHPDDEYLNLNCTLTDGSIIRYILSPSRLMDPRIAMFNELISLLYRRVPESYHHQQTLHSIKVIDIKNGFSLSYSEGCNPLIKNIKMKELIEARNHVAGNKEVARPPRSNSVYNFSTKQEHIEWFWHFANKYAAISLIHVVSGASCADPLFIAIGKKNASLVYGKIDFVNELDILRTCGSLTPFLSQPMMFGPVRTGIIAAASSIAFNRKQFLLYLATFVKPPKAVEDIVASIEKYSIRDNDAEPVQKEIDYLISRSQTCDDLAIVPWL